MKTQLAVVDTADVVRAGIREIVSASEHMDLVGEWVHLDLFLVFMEAGSVDVLLLGEQDDMTEALEQLSATHPKLKVVLLARQFTANEIDEFAKQGVMGFMCKDEALADFLVGALCAVKRGDVYISPHTARTLLLASSAHPTVSLTPRQRQVLHYMSDYMTPQEIAQRMRVSVSSIYNLQQRIRRALGVNTSGQILLEATRLGLIGELDG